MISSWTDMWNTKAFAYWFRLWEIVKPLQVPKWSADRRRCQLFDKTQTGCFISTLAPGRSSAFLVNMAFSKDETLS